MKLVHYTHKDTPLTEIQYKEQDLVRLSFKPTGFWVSDEDEYGWKQWCINEDFRLEHLELAYEIILAQDHNVQILTTIEEVDILTKNYPSSDLGLDWMKMREQWDGLIITPYHWELRLAVGHTWYYAWDCASGCIWNPAAVAEIRRLDTCQK